MSWWGWLLAWLAFDVLCLMFPGTIMRQLCPRRLRVAVLCAGEPVDIRLYPPWLWVLLRRPVAQVFGTTIVISALAWQKMDYERQLLLITHELVHVQQARRYGPFYLPLYLIGLLRHGYENHPMEKEARERSVR